MAYLAEVWRARELATPSLQLSNPEQRQWAEDLAGHLLQMGTDLPAVCIVDSGGIEATYCLSPHSGFAPLSA